VAAATTPVGWKCDRRTKRKAERLLPRLEDIIRKKVSHFKRIPGIDRLALLQEARLAAVYAIATHKPERGRKLRTWVDLVVRNALLAVVNYELGLKRAPRELEQDGKASLPNKRSRLSSFAGTDSIAHVIADDASSQSSIERQQATWDTEAVLQAMRSEDRRIFSVRLCPPPELSIMARNIRPGDPRITDRMIAEHLGVAVEAVKLATERAKKAWRSLERRGN